MACQHETPQHRSALEFEIHHETTAGLQLVSHDPTANAPERDHDVDAPECDLTFALPQGLLQVAHDQSLPEVVAAESDQEEHRSLQKSTPTICGLPRRKFWILLFVVLSAVVAVALGISFSRAPNSQLPVLHTILDGSALAAVTLSNGDRRLFFQDASGAIRESLYNDSTRHWTTHLNNIIATNARYNTPLTACKFPNPSDQTFLFYIALDNSIALRTSASDSWLQDHTGVSSFVAANDTRLLSAELFPVDGLPSGAALASLIFQDASGHLQLRTMNVDKKSWTEYPNFPHENEPFNADGCNFANTIDGDDLVVTPILVPIQPFPDNFDLTQVSVSEGANTSVDIYALAINGTAFESVCHLKADHNRTVHVQPRLSSAPASPFPFAKLAATSLTNGSALHVYHQINNTTFAEDVYDIGRGDWTSTNFSIPVT